MEKTRPIIVGLLIVSAVCLAQSPRTTRELTTMLQDAQYQEQTAGDLDKAIDLYQQVLAEAAEVERLAARAAFQLAVCYQKKGDDARAAEYYRKVVKEFSSQKALAERAQEQLEKLMATKVPEIVGHWQSVDFVSSPEQFQPGKKQWKGDLFLKEATFNANGSSSLSSRWTEGWIHDAGSDVKAEYYIKDIDGQTYLFLPWLSGDVTVRGQKPHYYVMKAVTAELPQHMVEVYRQKLEQPITINVTQSPDGERLTVQHAAIAIAEAAGVPYQWDKSARLADPQRRNYIEPLRVDGKPAAQAIVELLEPLEMGYGIDAGGVYLYSFDKLKAIVEKAVLTISTCAETDPRVKTSLDSLKGLPDEAVTAAVSAYLGEASPTVRRSAIYILWKGEFLDIAAAEKKLMELCSHPENFTRGMAALALGGNKVSAAYDAIAKMTLHDEDAYARRCAAYALGLLGDSKALPVLEQALQDKEDSVKRNAQAAITMLTKLTEMDSVSVKPSKPDKLRAEDLVAEGWTLWRQRKLIEAEQKFEEATAADPTHDGAYQGLGWAQLNQGKRDNAKVSFEKCVALNPQNSAALNGLGWIAYGQDDKDEAIGWWEKAVAAQAGATAALSGLTQVYMERRDYQNAIRCYQMWLKAEPNNQDAKNGLEKARQALAEAKN